MILSWMLLPSLPLLVVEVGDVVLAADKRKRMTSPGGVALACGRCENGSLGIR